MKCFGVAAQRWLNLFLTKRNVMRKSWKIFLWLLTNKPVLSLVWDVYQAAKDGRITKPEFDTIVSRLAACIGDVFDD